MTRKWLAFTLFVFTWSLTTHGKFSCSGDEPHYLMITQSLVSDHDLDVGNNYASNDGRLFGHPDLEMGLHALPARGGRLMPIHDIGTSVALVPVYAIAQTIATRTSPTLLRRFRMDQGNFAYSIIGLCLIAMTTTGMVLLASGLSELAGERNASLLVLLAAISPPIVSHAFLVFPEVFALFATSVVVWFVTKRRSEDDVRVVPIIAVALGCLPWTHHKYLVLVPGLALLIGWIRLEVLRALTPAALAFTATALVLPVVAFEFWTWHTWGTFGGALTTVTLPFAWPMFKAGFGGLFLDRQSGLLAYAPLYWVLPACVLLTRRQTWPFLVPALLLYLPAAAFVTGWWAGFAPAARYLVPAVPLFLAPIATALRYRTVLITVLALSVPQLVIDAAIWQRPRALWPVATGINPALQMLGILGRSYQRLLDPIQVEGIAFETYLRLGVWLVLSALLAGYTVRQSRRQRRVVETR